MGTPEPGLPEKRHGEGLGRAEERKAPPAFPFDPATCIGVGEFRGDASDGFYAGEKN